MDQSILKIADLSNYRRSQLEDVTIKASVSIRSLRHGNNRHGYFYLDLRDDSGDIPAVAYTVRANQLHLIQDNRTYMITNISLANSNIGDTSIAHEKEIVLNNNTVVKLCGNAPKVEWPLTPLNEVYDQDEMALVNIVGLCTGVMETEVVSGVARRRVTLVGEARSEVVLNVWSQETSLFDELDLNFHPVLFVKDARIHKYRGTTSVTTTRYLQLLHPDDPRAVKIRRIMQGSPPKNSMAEPNLNADRTVARIAPSQPAGYPYCTPANFTRNNQKYYYTTISNIADLASLSSAYNWTLIATVTVKSVRLTPNGNEHFYMDLRDDSGEIVAYVGADACVKFQNFIEKNKTYSFTGFNLATFRKFKERFTSIPHQNVLILDNDSDVKLCGTAPRVEWPLSPLTVVHAEDKTEFYQAFGLYTGIKGRTVTLVDQLDRELFLQVTGGQVAMFDALDLESRPVLFVKDASMSNVKHKGSKILRTGLYVELLEPDDPRARRVTEAVGNADSAQSIAPVNK